MFDWNSKAELAAAEKAYVAAEMDRLRLVCQRRQMKQDHYRRALDEAWLRSVEALETLVALRNAESVARLNQASKVLETA